MKSSFLGLFAALVALMFASCITGHQSVRGSGNVTTEDRNLSGFTKIDVDNGMAVTIEYGNVPAVTVEADDNVQPHILTRVDDKTLVITSDFNSFTDATMKITVTIPNIAEIDASGGTRVKSRNTLLSEALSIDVGSGSSVDLQIESDSIQADISGGSSLVLRGKALSFNASSSGGSSLKAGQFVANDIQAKASGGSSITVNPAVSLKARASSGSSINYKGEPKTVNIDESSGGSINKN